MMFEKRATEKTTDKNQALAGEVSKGGETPKDCPPPSAHPGKEKKPKTEKVGSKMTFKKKVELVEKMYAGVLPDDLSRAHNVPVSKLQFWFRVYKMGGELFLKKEPEEMLGMLVK